ncbi:hypothetical protein BOW53_13235 [Solemya pervernicosa gill symbiont]|uniref:ZIP family metal transporter n=1 Tax=Solemya pervernicosa gill symbiont TaxID=642797 RepID=A0A1T2L1S5_9GAMM|nr:ZIP family metal transporter [Solemya pervernicosa gill symbiont]OOZ39047.1 hypothetical protein BOW53_13235 [Solemya pervernicosa gill symbiont]
MDYLTLKILSILVIFAVGVFGGMIPVGRGSIEGKQRLFSLGSAFSGGIFIGAGLIHMLPDANEGFSDAFSGLDYPLAFFVCGLGFLLILFLDKIIFEDPDDSTTQKAKTGTPYILAFIL